MRYLVNINGKWQREYPDNVFQWLWANDGKEAVAVDDAEKVYYCATPAMMERYREAWAAEGKKGDTRTAAMFFDLGQKLHGADVVETANELF